MEEMLFKDMDIIQKMDIMIDEDKKSEYIKFFKAKLKEHGVKSPAELSKEEKKKFFSEIEKEWSKENK